MIWRKPYEWCIENAEHLKAVGETDISIDPATAPWDKVVRVQDGGSRRFDGPCGVYMVVEEAGLTLKWDVEFECRGANGQGASLFDRDRLREVMRKIPDKARIAFAVFLERECLPDLQKRTSEIREALNKQADSEDCVRGLIAFGKQK